MEGTTEVPFRLTEPEPLGLMDIIELIAPGAMVTGWERLVGGLGSAMHRVDVAMPSGAATSFVLRRPNPEFTSRERVVREAETLEKLRPTHVPAPELLWLDPDGNAFGQPAMAITLLPGNPSVATEDPMRWAAQLAQALGGVHLVPPGVVDHLTVLGPDALMSAILEERRDTVSPYVDIEAMRAALLRGVEDVAPGDTRLLHGDFHGGQVLRADDGQVTGIVDWEHAHVGDPRFDVAYCHYDTSLLHGAEAADAFVERYVALTGRALTDAWWWGLLAAMTSLPDPADWAESMAESGGPVTPDLVRERARRFVDERLRAAGA